MSKNIEELRKQIDPILKRNDVEFAAIFGSFARNEQTENSDLDILIRYAKRKSLLDLVRLERELSESLDMKVQVVTERSLHPYIRPSVQEDLKVLYGQRQYV